MPVKRVQVDQVGLVSLYKRSGVRSLRLTIGPSGEVRVTLPKWAPYKVAIEFVRSRRQWIRQHQPVAAGLLLPGDHVGKSHRLSFLPGTTGSITTRVTGTLVIIRGPAGRSWQDEQLQAAARKACLRALKRQAEQLLPMRVRQLAAQHGFSYRSVTIKQLKARWGSCNHRQELVFNLFLMQLPWELIDYVILHELQHTTILRHGPSFWDAMMQHTPDVLLLRKKIRTEQPVLQTVPSPVNHMA